MRVIEMTMERCRNEKAGKREIPEKTRRPTASSGTIPTCENPVNQQEIEPALGSQSGDNPVWTNLRSQSADRYATTREQPQFRAYICSLVKRTGFDSLRGRSRIIACGIRAWPCRWSASFLGDILFPQPFHSSAVTYSSHFPLISYQDLDVKRRPDISTPLHWDKYFAQTNKPAP
ncbi:hypothetical protein PR048_022501 [Dryococelus australis]|uniref:Uncharacterized protein n=1 Tax=Dryococelus australis TaxID=614101 RepID=A0ABQ9H166_9NEOP|nr:hypothetical protein PR048_022501 [Dryococelus australis]